MTATLGEPGLRQHLRFPAGVREIWGRRRERRAGRLENPGQLVPTLLSLAAAGRREQAARRSLWAALVGDGLAAAILDGIADPTARQREESARLCGLLMVDEAEPWLEVLLWDRNRRVRQVAARALGRLGGARSAEALLGALRRGRISAGRAAMEVARAAPEGFIEQALTEFTRPALRSSLILAAGLRRRKSALPFLIQHLSSPHPDVRAATCRCIGWLRYWPAVPELRGLLGDPDAGVRRAALRALTQIGDRACGQEIVLCLFDRDPGVRAAARWALRRMGATVTPPEPARRRMRRRWAST
jgi:HEAT repeat protein